MHFIYDSLISPLILLLEFFFKLVDVITKNPGLAVISLSFIVTLLTLPLYMVAEKWQETERQLQGKMKTGIERIKSTFKGDEQYMILNTYYRQNHYHPIMALRSSFSLLIQIPFFMAAYNFLSNLNTLQGYSFFFIKDFGAPDATFKIGAIAINILPILMTLINCVAGYIYSRGHGAREQIQIYACALVFLILLYNSPSGLVVYWTMNNVLSLVKNIFYKIKNPKKAIYIISCITALILLAAPFTVLRNVNKLYKIAFVLLAAILVSYPYIIKFLTVFFDNNLKYLDSNSKKRTSIFLLSSIVIAVLAGLVIPSILIESQPDLYCYVDDYTSPYPFIITTFAKALGFFVLWPLCFYFLFSDKTKNILTCLFAFSALFATINTFCFSGKYGSINPTLIFMEPQNFFPSISAAIVNMAVLIVLLALVFILIRKKIVILQSFITILLFAFFAISAINLSSIRKSFNKMEGMDTSEKIQPVYHLSKNGKNVILIMQDACLTPLIPEIFKDNPELKEHFEGFTYYPNTVSLGSVTMTGSPGLFGGYDYTPYEVNMAENKTLQQKHNEALLTLPVLFNRKNFDTTVSNLPYENYLEEPVTSMYESYKFVNRINTTGKYSKIWYDQKGLKRNPHTSFLIKRNFICFSLFKMVPPVLRGIVYSHEYWIAHTPYEDSADFVNHYSVLEYLPELTDMTSSQGSFVMIDNELTHEDVYATNEEIPGRGKTPFFDDPVFKIHAAVFIKYAEFFDYLKKNGIYDNTRIIIASDHGRSLKKHSLQEIGLDLFNQRLTATLLVKDFSSHSPLAEDNTFMTNADVPYLTTKGIIDNAKNPFTENILKINNKQDYVKIAVPNSESTRIRHNTKFKINPENWYTVHDDIYKKENWSHWEP